MNVKFVSIFNEFLLKTTISMNLKRKRDKIDFSNDFTKKKRISERTNSCCQRTSTFNYIQMFERTWKFKQKKKKIEKNTKKEVDKNHNLNRKQLNTATILPLVFKTISILFSKNIWNFQIILVSRILGFQNIFDSKSFFSLNFSFQTFFPSNFVPSEIVLLFCFIPCFCLYCSNVIKIKHMRSIHRFMHSHSLIDQLNKTKAMKQNEPLYFKESNNISFGSPVDYFL